MVLTLTLWPLFPLYLDAVGVSDHLVDVRCLVAQPRRVVLQDHALAGAAVQAVGPLSLCHTCTRPLVGPTTYCDFVFWLQRVQNDSSPETDQEGKYSCS